MDNAPVPAHMPQYEDLQRRLETYHNWPVPGLTPQELAESGFVYNGTEDKTVCFHCGVLLKAWQSSDDADIEHARFSPECGFLQEKKGKSFVRSALEMYELPVPASILVREAPRGSTSTATRQQQLDRQQQQQQQQLERQQLERQQQLAHQQQTRAPIVNLRPQPPSRADAPQPRRGPIGTAEPRQIRARLDTDWGKRLMQQGFPRELVGQVFGERLQMEGDDFPTFRELLDAVLAAADALRIDVPLLGSTNRPQVAPPPAQNPYFEGERQQGEPGQQSPGTSERNLDTSTGLNQGANRYIPEANAPSMRSEDPALQSAEELNKDLKRKLFCRRCLQKEADILFLCCNRRVSCEDCAYDVTSCLVCGALEQERIKVFVA